jgi:hypothetical protein
MKKQSVIGRRRAPPEEAVPRHAEIFVAGLAGKDASDG